MTDPKVKARKKRVIIGVISFASIAIIAAIWIYARRHVSSVPLQIGLRPATAAPLSRWPWPQSTAETLQRGVTRWKAAQKDGTTVDLLQFDFRANPSLRFELFDQDEDDAKPFDNSVRYWPRGAAQMTRQLNARAKNDRVVALWSGLFFGFKGNPTDPKGIAFHVSPLVLRGRVHFNTANHRWAFGWKNVDGAPRFKTFHQPSRAILEKEFDYASGSAQCLIRNGVALELERFPRSRDDFKKQPVASTPREAGHIPVFDHMRTCRIAMAWPRDSSKLWLIVVKEPDIEAGSAVALKRGLPVAGGWTVPDVSRFWQSFSGANRQVWGAINSDAGDVAQLVYARRGGYEMIPPRWDSNLMRFKLRADFSNAPRGGAMMYFAVRESKKP